MVTTNASLLEAETSSSRRRRRCTLWPPNRYRYAGDNRPGTYYMIAHAYERTQLESFSSAADVRWTGYWADYVTRIEIDWRGREVRRKCSCGTCDNYFKWAKKKLYTVTECKEPSGRWKQVFSVFHSSADQTYTYSTWTGRQFTRSNTVTESLGVAANVAYGPFSASASYSYVAERQSSNTWSSGGNTSHSWFVERGQSAVVWKYELAAKCFNEVGMFMEELTFGTNIFHGKKDSWPPTCDPNEPGDCGADIGALSR